MPPNCTDSFFPAPATEQFGESDPGLRAVVMHDSAVMDLPSMT